MTAEPRPALPRASRRVATLINLAFHYSAMGFNIVQGVVLVPLYLAHVPAALYGAWIATGNVLTWLDLVDVGVSDVLRQRVAVAYGRDDPAALARAIGTGLTLNLCLSAVPLLAWPLAGLVPPLVHLTGAAAASLVWSFRVALLGTALTLASYGVASVSLGLQLTLSAGVVYTASSVCGLALTGAMLVTGHGLVSIPAGMLVRAAILFAGNAARVAHWCARHLPERPRFVRRECREILGLSVYTFTSRLGGTLLDRMDAFITANRVSPRAALTLSMTGKAIDPARMAIASVSSALMPSLSHLVGEGRDAYVAALCMRVIRLTAGVTAVAAGSIIALNGPFVRLWVGREFFGGEALTIALCLAAGTSLFSATLNRIIYAVGGIRQSSRATLAEALVKLPLQLLLLRRIGLIGMPVASIAGTLVVGGWYLPMMTARLLRLSARERLGLRVASLGPLVVLSAAGAGLHALFARADPAWTWPRFVAAAALTGAALTALLVAIDAQARRELVDASRRFLRRRYLDTPPPAG